MPQKIIFPIWYQNPTPWSNTDRSWVQYFTFRDKKGAFWPLLSLFLAFLNAQN